MKASDKPWFHRRLQVYLLSAFAMACIGYLAAFGSDTQLNRDIVQGAFLLLMSSNGFYQLGKFGNALATRDTKTTTLDVTKTEPLNTPSA